MLATPLSAVSQPTGASEGGVSGKRPGFRVGALGALGVPARPLPLAGATATASLSREWFAVEFVSAFFYSSVPESTGATPVEFSPSDSRFPLDIARPFNQTALLVAFSPLRGPIDIAGSPGSRLELFIATGGGPEVRFVDAPTTGPIGRTTWTRSTQVLPRFTTAAGVRLWGSSQVALRTQLRLAGGPEQILDYSTDEAANQNRELPAGSSRVDCASESVAAQCRTVPSGTLLFEVGIELAAPR